MQPNRHWTRWLPGKYPGWAGRGGWEGRDGWAGPVLSIRDVGKSYFGTPVLADVTLLAEQYGLDRFGGQEHCHAGALLRRRGRAVTFGLRAGGP